MSEEYLNLLIIISTNLYKFMTRTEIINSLIDKHDYTNYLEIGVNTPSQPGYNWIGVKAQSKTGVDPNVDTTFKMTSDEFFQKIPFPTSRTGREFVGLAFDEHDIPVAEQLAALG